MNEVMNTLNIYERVILYEREVMHHIKELSRWMEHALGLHDVEEENKYILKSGTLCRLQMQVNSLQAQINALEPGDCRNGS